MQVQYGKREEKRDHDLKLAITRIDVASAGTISLGEKGVDAYLMLGLLDELDNSETSAMCLISNDSDYYPIVERIKETSLRPFFLASTVPIQRVSSALRQVVGKEWIVSTTSTDDLKGKELSYMSDEWLEAIGTPYR